jgi:hypothetical protein
LEAFILRYTDVSKTGDQTGNRLRYSDFCAAIAPKDRFYLNTLAQRAPRNLNLQYSYEEIFSEAARLRYFELW